MARSMIAVDGVDVVGDALQELRALLGGGFPVAGEGGGRSGAGGVDVGGVAVVVDGLEGLAGGGVEGVDGLAGSADGFAGDEHLSGEASGLGNCGSHVVLGRRWSLVCHLR